MTLLSKKFTRTLLARQECVVQVKREKRRKESSVSPGLQCESLEQDNTLFFHNAGPNAALFTGLFKKLPQFLLFKGTLLVS